jgi:putative hydrolase of the HAD superfamily
VNKPDVRIFEYALKETGASLNQSVMIGDNFDADILGAFNFGMDQIWLNLYDEKPTGFEPTFTITDLIELKEIL